MPYLRISMMSKWFYFPRTWEYGLPWLVGTALTFAFALFGLPKVRQFEADLPATIGVWIAAVMALALFNALLLWVHMRAQFLTIFTAAKPLTGTYVVLTTAYLALFGIVAMARGHTRFTLRAPDALHTAYSGAAALCAISIAWGASSVFLKGEDPGTSSVRLKRRTAVRLLGELRSGLTSAANMKILVDTLGELATSAATAATQLSEPRDRALAGAWAEAARRLQEQLTGLSARDCLEMDSEFKDRVAEREHALRRMA